MIETIKLSLFPEENLSVVYLPKLQNPVEKAQLAIDSSKDDSSFAIMDASFILSRDHIGYAATMALIRRKKTTASNANNSGWTVALETVICATGSSRGVYALRDYGFRPIPSDDAAASKLSNGDEQTHVDVLLFGFNANEEDLKKLMDGLCSVPPAPLTDLFERQKNEKYYKDIIKAYKIGGKEIRPDKSNLEECVLNRIATKFLV